MGKELLLRLETSLGNAVSLLWSCLFRYFSHSENDLWPEVVGQYSIPAVASTSWMQLGKEEL